MGGGGNDGGNDAYDDPYGYEGALFGGGNVGGYGGGGGGYEGDEAADPSNYNVDYGQEDFSLPDPDPVGLDVDDPEFQMYAGGPEVGPTTYQNEQGNVVTEEGEGRSGGGADDEFMDVGQTDQGNQGYGGAGGGEGGESNVGDPTGGDSTQADKDDLARIEAEKVKEQERLDQEEKDRLDQEEKDRLEQEEADRLAELRRNRSLLTGYEDPEVYKAKLFGKKGASRVFRPGGRGGAEHRNAA